MIDARRDEVFMKKIYRNKPSTNIEATVLTENFFNENWIEVAFVGNSNEKATRILNVQPQMQINGPIASQLVDIAFAKMLEKHFENVAYFEPFYLKDFVPGISKKFAV
jgi:tRNA threonylcarbamoyladenosine biosynthesis protein TsaB